MSNLQNDLPDFLSGYGSLYNHLQGQMEGLNTVQIGEKFSTLAEHLIPHTESGQDFERSIKSKLSWDRGVDISFKHRTEADIELRAQVKYTISAVDDIDLIISKFRDFESSTKEKKQGELDFLSDTQKNPTIQNTYLIVTASRISNIISKYEKTQRPSLSFYNQLKNENRFQYIDGDEILKTFQSVYRSAYIRPHTINVKLETSFIQLQNVYVGIIPCHELRRIYQSTGDSIFFENIREWLGFQGNKVKSGGRRETVNEAIAATLEESPEKMLERNNGIALRASKITILSENELSLEEASIVNGCQTTMSIFFANPRSGHVLAKFVETDDSWEIAKSANFQTPIERVELELARYLRPQLVRLVGAETSYKVGASNAHQKNKSAFSILDQIYKDEICYDELKSIFIGLFSRSANNAIAANYTELKIDLLKSFEEDPDKNNLLEALFLLHSKSAAAMETLKEGILKTEIMDLFKRFWKEDKPSYRGFVSLLAIFSITNKPQNKFSNYEDLKRTIIQISNQIDSDPTKFTETYIKAFKSIAIDVLKSGDDKDRMLQSMYRHIGSINFDNALLAISLL
ncbi:ISNCY family transposase [Pseudomonas chlororaphis]|uniref:ISNCY family transposase n=1 Tax=Pseudomonas chlororaphis TaxID=587753 RepID=A0AB34C0N6_9PSED|nr:AIPR family protein [Pseudomonas chlororaphis]KAA5839670.1 ISNCY family transposase [Pseudomonas chlororaphis]